VRIPTPWIPAILVLATAMPGAAAAKPKAGAAQTEKIKKLTAERDELLDRLKATESLQEDLAAAQKSRDLARQETEAVRRQLDQIKAALAENQGSADALLKEIQKGKDVLAARDATILDLQGQLARLGEQKAAEAAKAIVPITPEIIPAKPMNLNKVTPKAKKVHGVVVVNVLVAENGDVLETRLLQGLLGEGEWVDKAHEACLEAAKRIVFDPARTVDGNRPVRVWQGVGFLLD